MSLDILTAATRDPIGLFGFRRIGTGHGVSTVTVVVEYFIRKICHCWIWTSESRASRKCRPAEALLLRTWRPTREWEEIDAINGMS